MTVDISEQQLKSYVEQRITVQEGDDMLNYQVLAGNSLRISRESGDMILDQTIETIDRLNFTFIGP